MYKRYEEYKDSGIEWIGYIPEHWEMVTLKRRLKVVNGGTPKSEESTFWDDGNIIWVTPDDLSRNQEKYIYDSKRKITDKGLKNSSASLVPPNSLVVSTRAPIGYVKITGDKISTNQGCKSLIKRNSDIDEVYYYYSLLFKKDYLNVMGQGTTFTELSNYNLANCPASLPPYNEQKAISTYLERVDSEIDSLIADKEKLIKKLEEYKQSIITEAVTNGLNPDVKMKDSGIEWIGEIPKHWKTKQLKHTFKLIYRYPTYYGIEYLDRGVIEIRGEMLTDNGLIDVNNNPRYISNDTSERFPMTKLKEYDLVMSVRGTMGKIGFVTKELVNSNITANLIRLSPKHELVNTKWLLWLMLSELFKKEMDKYTDKTTIKTIRVPWLIKIEIPLPTLEEQKRIALFLDKKYVEIENLANDIKEQIQNLKQYRQSLIYEAVTGKIDVRDHQPERSEQLA